MVLLRPDKPPRHLLNTLNLPKGARVLVSAALKDGTWLVATNLGLVVARGGAAVFHAWDKIDRAALRRSGSALAVTFAGAREPTTFRIEPKDKRLASIVHERVRASVVDAEPVAVPGGQVIVALRRDPANQHVYLQEIADPEADQAAGAPLVRAARQRLAEAAGLPPAAW